jgi:NitT/TauT family transport system substrate-binding protein
MVVVLVAALAACSALNGTDDQPATSAANRGLEKPTIRVGVIQILDAAPFYLAQARGYFAAEGLTVQVVSVRSGTDVLPMLASHTLDIGLGNWATLFQAEANKVGDYKILADAAQGRPHTMIVAARPDSGIHGPKDLIARPSRPTRRTTCRSWRSRPSCRPTASTQAPSRRRWCTTRIRRRR